MSSREAAAQPWRLSDGELISACCALVLLVTMFALEWYEVVGLPGPEGRSGISSAEDAWHGLTVLRWLMLLTIAVALGSVILHATQRSHGTQTDMSVAVTSLGALTLALLIDRVLIDLPSPSAVVDVKLGAYLGLLSASGIVLGGYESVREERANRTRAAPRSRAQSRLASGADPR